MKICVTGHRPNKLYGYDLTDNRWSQLKDTFKQVLVKQKCTEAITGMALGVDTVFALAVLELKNEGYNIKLHCAIPCTYQYLRWSSKDQKLYFEIINSADVVKTISQKYNRTVMQKRNEYMVDNSDIVLAVWDGSNSGTANCIRYAKYNRKRILYVEPKTFNISEKKE